MSSCMRYQRFWKRLGALAGLLLAVFFLLWGTINIWGPLLGSWISQPATIIEHVEQVDVIVVHGGNPKRTRYALELYQQGIATRIWHTGYAHDRETIEPLIQRQDVPMQDFTWLTTNSTWEDGKWIAATLQQQEVEDVLIVTDWWHSRRALRSTREHLNNQDVIIYFSPNPNIRYGPDTWWEYEEGRKNVLRELAKLGAYWILYDMEPWHTNP